MAIEIVDFPIENCDFPSLCKRLPEGNTWHGPWNMDRICKWKLIFGCEISRNGMFFSNLRWLDLRACLEFRGWLTRSKCSRATPQEHWDCRGPSLRFFLANRSFHRVISSSCKMQWSKGAPGSGWNGFVSRPQPGPTHLIKWVEPQYLSLSRFPHLIYLLHI